MMQDRSLGRRGNDRAPDRPTSLAAGIFCCLTIVFAVAVSPLILGWLYGDSDGYTVVADIGQAYGGAAAMVAALALFLLGISAFLQYRSTKAERAQFLVEMNEELVSAAMQNPKYRQCFGARLSPDHIDEDLYYFCGKVLRLWTSGWALGILREVEARQYLRSFFESEIPRLYWQSHGDWHIRGPAVGRRLHFRSMVNEEYLRAVKGGPPSRPFEHEATHPTMLDRLGLDSTRETASLRISPKTTRKRRPA